MNRTKSNELHHEALSHLVGGVNSPVRAFKSVHGNPIYFEKASGAHVTDVDGNLLQSRIRTESCPTEAKTRGRGGGRTCGDRVVVDLRG